jgi:drug/metabolite transporter (DMT)-like permease
MPGPIWSAGRGWATNIICFPPVSLIYSGMQWASVYLLVCTIIWGWTFVATRVCLQYLSPVELLGLRFLIGLPLLLVIVLARRVRFEFTSRERRAILLGSAIITVHFLIQITGLKYTTATNTGWIMAVIPLVMAVLAFLILKERLGRRAIIGIAVATAGILLLMSRGKFGSFDWLRSFGDWLVLASAHTWALYTIVIRDVTRSRNPLAVTVAVLAPSAAVVLGYMLVRSDWSRFVHMPLDGIVALLFLGLLGLAVGHWFWQEGVARVGAARAGIYLYLEPVATTALAVPYLGEEFGPWTALGGLLVLAGVYLAERHNNSSQIRQKSDKK